MRTTADIREFNCPNEECGWVGWVRWIPDSRTDPGYWETDPPEECPDCGAEPYTTSTDDPA